MLSYLLKGALSGLLVSTILFSGVSGPDALGLLLFLPFAAGAFVIAAIISLFAKEPLRLIMGAIMAFSATFITCLMFAG
jgi:hypothetical protein